MAEARQRHEWSMTANVLALLANIHRPKGRAAFNADDFNPFALRERKVKGSIHDFKSFLPKNGKPAVLPPSRGRLSP